MKILLFILAVAAVLFVVMLFKASRSHVTSSQDK